ncbi:MAG: hypothetical protein ABIG10_00600 [bacterium]
MESNKLKTIILFLIIGIVIGYFANNLFNNTYKDGWEAARQKLAINRGEESQVLSLSGAVKEIDGNKIIITASLLNPLDDEDLMTRIIKVNKDTVIKLKETKTYKDWFDKDTYSEITLLEEQMDNSSTREEAFSIRKEIDKLKADANEIKRGEIDKLQEKMRKIDSNDTEARGKVMQEIIDLSSGFKYTDISIEQIDANLGITVEAEKDISRLKEFTASKIEVRK